MQPGRVFIHLPTSDVQKMVDFYSTLGLSIIGTPGVREGKLVFARLELNGFEIRIEYWDSLEWETLRKGFSYTTFWIDAPSVEEIVDRLNAANIAYTGPHCEEYGSMELELFDPEGFRIICSENRALSTSPAPNASKTSLHR